MSEIRPRDELPRVAVAGATGFVGRALVRALRGRARVVALGRRAPASAGDGAGTEWRRCDLFSLRETEQALEGVDVAFYLVHSMLPNARLTQGRFEDLDFLLADNFGRAAGSCGLQRIIYLGGLIPRDRDSPGSLSPHLASRLEVERALAAHGVPVTAVRAGLIVGRGGSSLEMLVRLVQRLPVMLCPRWTGTLTQPIALDDVIAILLRCLEDDETIGRVCEVGGPDVLSYRDMMGETARVLGLRRFMLPVPLFSPGLSRLWVSLFTGAPRELAAPLVQSLRHPMLAQDRWLQERMDHPGRPFAESLAEAARSEWTTREPTVRSVQRLPLPPGRDAPWVAREYIAWLPRLFRWVLRVVLDGPAARFHLRGMRRPLLELTYRPERSHPGRALLEVTGGRLVKPAEASERPARLEFRLTPEGDRVLAVVQDFRPRLPWWLYSMTQARVHVWVMRAFGRHLRKSASPAQPEADLDPAPAAPPARSVDRHR